jgi:hypothetical protein
MFFETGGTPEDRAIGIINDGFPGIVGKFTALSLAPPAHLSAGTPNSPRNEFLK